MSGIVGKNLGRGSGVVTATPVGADTVSGASIVDDAIDSEHYADGSIDNAHIADDAIDSEHYADGSIDNAHIADDAIDSEHYVDGSIDNAHIADDAIDSEHYADGSIDNAHIADDAIDSEHYADGSIDEAHIADNAVTLAKMAGGTDGNIISFDASGDPVAIATGDDGQVLTSTGAGSPPAFEDASGGGFTLGTEQATTSGTSFNFGSIPAGTKIIHIMFDGVGLDGTQDMWVQIGDAGGIETSSYISSSCDVENSAATRAMNTTSAFGLAVNNAAYILTGTMTLTLKDGTNHDWISSHHMKTSTTTCIVGGGSKSLSAELTQLTILDGGSDNFDAGSINISYL